MVEVGSIQIGGSINTIEIERGFIRIQGGFNEIKAKTKSSQADFVRMGQATKRLAKSFNLLAVGGVAAMVGIAKNSPAVAGAMARINVGMTKLSIAAGKALKPSFDLAAEGLEKIVNLIDSHPNMFQGIVTGIGSVAAATGAIGIGGWVYKKWKDFALLIGGIFATISSIATGIGAKITAGATAPGPASAAAGGAEGAMAGLSGLGTVAPLYAVGLAALIQTYRGKADSRYGLGSTNTKPLTSEDLVYQISNSTRRNNGLVLIDGL